MQGDVLCPILLTVMVQVDKELQVELFIHVKQ